MKKLLALILALVMVLSLVACGAKEEAPKANETPKADSSSTKVEDKTEEKTEESTATPVKMGVLIWGTTDALGRNSTMMIEKMVKQTGGEMVVDSSYNSPETQIQSAENLIAGGCNAIIICNSSDDMLPKLAQVCEDNKVYFGLMWRRILSEDVKAALAECPYFVGFTAEDEVEVAHRLTQNLVDIGVTKAAIMGNTVGDTTHDNRWKGFMEVVDSTDLECVAEFRSQGGSAAETMEAMEKFITGFPDLEAVFLTGGTNSKLEGALAALEKHNKRTVIKMAVVDFIDADDMKEFLEDGTLATIAGGHYVDPVFTCALLCNAVQGNKLTEGYAEINLPFIDFQSLDDCLNYYKFVENETDGLFAYTEEELGNMLVSKNPEMNFETLKQIAADYSVDEVMARHGN